MTINIDWQAISAALPGIFLKDQDPAGCGLAVSLEAAGKDEWFIHYAQEHNGKPAFYKTKPLSAFAVFQTLEKLFKNIGYTPELSCSEYEMLELPRKESIFNRSLAEKMPGEWLGIPDGEEESGWVTHYSLVVKGDGKYILYTGSLTDGDDFLSKAEIEKYGVYDLSEILEELRLMGFIKNRLAFLHRLNAESWVELEKQLPGAVLKNPDTSADITAICICPFSGDSWKIFTVKKENSASYSFHEQPDAEARTVYHYVYDHLDIIIPDTAREKVNLPSLDTLFNESIEKKLKGYYIGAISGLDEKGQQQKRFVSLQRESKISWTMHYVKSEELLSGNRKIIHHKTDPFLEENIYRFFLKLEPLFDPLDIYAKMNEQKNPEIYALAQLFWEQIT